MGVGVIIFYLLPRERALSGEPRRPKLVHQLTQRPRNDPPTTPQRPPINGGQSFLTSFWATWAPLFPASRSDIVSGCVLTPFCLRFGLHFGSIGVIFRLKNAKKRIPTKKCDFSRHTRKTNVFSCFSGSPRLKISTFLVPRATFSRQKTMSIFSSILCRKSHENETQMKAKVGPGTPKGSPGTPKCEPLGP